MTEPIYIAQNGDFGCLNSAERRAWFQERAAEAKAAGAVMCRATVDNETEPTIALLEGWDTTAADQGEPRWQMSPTQDTPAPTDSKGA